MIESKNSLWKYMNIMLIPILLVVDSLHFIFARLLHPLSPPGVSVLFVLLTATVEVGMVGAISKQLNFSEIKRNWWLFAAIGVLIATSTTINYQAVEFIDPGIASLLAQTGAVWAVLFGLIWLREDLNRSQAIGGLLALVGVFIVNYKAGDYVQIGSLLVILSAALYAFHSALTKKFSGDIGLTSFFFARLLASSAAIFLFTFFSRSLVWPSRAAWPYILLTGTIDVAVSRYLYYFALRKVRLTVLTIILTLSPVVAILWSTILFNSKLSSQQIIGGIIVIAGVLIVGLRRNRNAWDPEESEPDPLLTSETQPEPQPNREGERANKHKCIQPESFGEEADKGIGVQEQPGVTLKEDTVEVGEHHIE